jgi:hypothetical protein
MFLLAVTLVVSKEIMDGKAKLVLRQFSPLFSSNKRTETITPDFKKNLAIDDIFPNQPLTLM